MAKLLSKRERTVVGQATASPHAAFPQPVFFAFGMLLFGILRRIRMEIDQAMLPATNGSTSDKRCCLIHFSFRPPPPTAL